MITVVLVDDLPSARQGLRMLLELEPDVTVVGEAGDGVAALEVVARLDPDVVVVDLEMPHVDGIATIRSLKRHGARALPIVHTIHDGAATRLIAAEAGAAFVAKHEGYPCLVAAIRALVRPPS